ncbi:hypothetical protein QOZ84_02415 [Romboutsia sedimentorum]|uniref:Uncharacterized protein n=1 Tax=Romboutsia sedimentorum TaxID=1368474 RepID=A0ABT7E8I2_9FIRM|nr:hypothetical protein [Romboutsia sedimentorum]MDK2562388.1 hypothetical protein [Romboutsia sedimentorum]
MFNKKKIISISLMIILIVLVSLLVVFNKSTNSNVKQTAVNNENSKSENLEDLSIQQLTILRDNDIDKNLEDLSNTFQNRKDGILNSDLGLVAFFNKNYKNLTEKEKLIKQIKLIEYLNSINEIMDSAGDYFNVVNKDYELSEYLLENGRDSDTTSYENLKFLINNLEDVSNSIDYDVVDILESINPSIKTSLSKNQKASLDNELKKISLDDNGK